MIDNEQSHPSWPDTCIVADWAVSDRLPLGALDGTKEKPGPVASQSLTRPGLRGSGSLDGGGDGFGRSRLSIGPGRVDLVGKGRHPVVGQDVLQRLPNDKCWVLNVSDCDEHVGAMDSESLTADPAGAEDHRPATRLSMQTHRRDDVSAQPKCRAIGLGLVADFD